MSPGELNPIPKFFDKYDLVVSLEWITISDQIAYRVACCLTARGISRCAHTPAEQREKILEKRLAAQQSILLFQRGFRIHKW